MQRPFVPRHVLSTLVVGMTVTATSYVYACSRPPESGPAKNLSRFHPQSEAHFQKPSSAVADPISQGHFAVAVFAGLMLLLMIYFTGAEKGATSLVSGSYLHEFVHDGRHLLGFPCH